MSSDNMQIGVQSRITRLGTKVAMPQAMKVLET